MVARSPARREVIVRFCFRDYVKYFMIISGCSSVGRMRHLGCRGRGIVPRHPDNALIICFEYSSRFIEDGVIQKRVLS